MSLPVLSGIGDALDFYQRHVTDPVSGSILLGLNRAKMGLGLGDDGSDALAQYGDGLPSFGGTPTSDPSGALNYAYHDNPLGRFAFQTATDPLNLVGLGLPGKLAETGLLHAIPYADHALSALDTADKLPGAVGGKALDVAGSLGGAVAKPVASTLEPYLARFSDTHPDVAQGWQDTTRVWKSLQHMIPGYPLMTSADDLTLMGANGQWRAAADAAQAMPGAIKNGFAGSGTTGMGLSTKLQDEMGWEQLPHAISDAGVPGSWPGVAPDSTDSIFSKWGTQPEQYDQQGNLVASAKTGPLRSLADKLAQLDTMSKNIEQQSELAKRGSQYGQSYAQAVAPDVELAANKLEGYGFPDTAQDLRDSQGIYSPSRLAAELKSQGASNSVLKDVIGDGTGRTGWQNAVQRAGGFGDTYVSDPTPSGAQYLKQLPKSLEPTAAADTNRILYRYRNNPIGDVLDDYTFGGGTLPTGLDAKSARTTDLSTISDPDLRNSLRDARAEAVMRDVAQSTFGGYKFATQNIPAFARLSAQHPALANVPAEYYRDSDYYNYQHGLPASFHGSMPVPGIDGAYVNPLGLSSMAELVGAATDHDSETGSTDIGNAISTLGKLQLGVNPILKLGAQLTGQMGDHQMSDILRPDTAVSGLASLATGQPQDIEGPIKNLVGTAQQALTGQETFPYQDYLVRSRQGELSGTGNKWAATQTDGPLHDQASQDIAHRLGIQDLMSTLSPLDLKTITPEAQAIGRNSYTSNYLGSRGLLTAAAANPTAHVYDLADPLAERVARFETLPVEERMALLRDPRALELLQKQRSMQLHNPQALAAG